MSNYSSILESYLIDIDGIAEESAGDTLRKFGTSIKNKVQELIRFIVKLWNRAKESIRNMTNNVKAAKTAKFVQKEVDAQNMSEHYYRTGVDIGNMVKAFGNSSERVYARCIHIIAVEMMSNAYMVIEYEEGGQKHGHLSYAERSDMCKKFLEKLDNAKNDVIGSISELPNLNSDIDDKLSSLKNQSIAMSRTSKSELRRGFMTVYPDPNHLMSVFSDRDKSLLIGTLNDLASLKPNGLTTHHSLNAISKVIITAQTMLSSLNSYSNAIHKVESKIFNLMHST